MPASFYLPLGDGRFTSTEHTSGPWDAALQHAGPPSALLARAVEQQPGAWPSIVTRVSVDLLGPVPVAELTVTAEILRSGRSVELVKAELSAGNKLLARATAWRIRLAQLELPPTAEGHDGPAGQPPPKLPDHETPLPESWGGGYLAAMQWRQAHGNWGPPGPAAVWARMRYPLVADEVPTGLQRVMAIADSGNGVSHVLPVDKWLFINTELTVHLGAVPRGEWICLDAHTRIDPSGFGLAASQLFDRDRLVGRAAQSLFVGPR
jgi:hypothetical protein